MLDVSQKSTWRGHGPVLFRGARATALRRTAPYVPQGQLRAPCGQLFALSAEVGVGGKKIVPPDLPNPFLGTPAELSVIKGQVPFFCKNGAPFSADVHKRIGFHLGKLSSVCSAPPSLCHATALRHCLLTTCLTVPSQVHPQNRGGSKLMPAF